MRDDVIVLKNKEIKTPSNLYLWECLTLKSIESLSRLKNFLTSVFSSSNSLNGEERNNHIRQNTASYYCHGMVTVRLRRCANLIE